ncbi:MAG: uroporphyrinogen decarboxylase family protein [Sedimentisphaerales bacterium]
MNSLQRVLTTVRHCEPDRVPIGEWGIDHDHVSNILGRHTYWRNRRDYTLALWEGRRDEAVESEKKDYVDLVRALDYDVVTVDLVPHKGYACDDPPQQIEENVWKDSKGGIYKYAASNDSIMCMTSPPAKESLTDDDIAALYKQLETFDDSQFEVADHICNVFADTRAVLFRGLNLSDIFFRPFGGNMSHRLMMTVAAPDEIKKLWDFIVQYNVMLMRKCAQKNIKIVMAGHDFGTTKNCFFSRQTVQDLFIPPIKQICDEARKLGLHIFLHSCGWIWSIMDDIIDAGIEGYQSIQESAGMDTKKVKTLYGDKLTLWTGIQCETLVDGAASDVEEEVHRLVNICKPGGGFIFGSTNSVQYGAKTENYLKSIDTVRKCGVY